MSGRKVYEVHYQPLKTNVNQILPNGDVILKGVAFSKVQSQIVSSLVFGGFVIGAALVGILWLIFN